jgi:hypothetical protein
MLRDIADGKSILVDDAQVLARAVLAENEIARAAHAVLKADGRFALRRLVELLALLVERGEVRASDNASGPETPTG